jgi:hypothetical protein
MRFIGLALCLLASTFGARADSLEDRVTALELRVKVLEDTLRAQGVGEPITAANLDGDYKALLPNGGVVNATFDKGKVVANDGKLTQTGTYEVDGQKVKITLNGKTESVSIQGNHLVTDDKDQIVFTRVVTAAPAANIDGTYQAIFDGKTLSLELADGKAVVSKDQEKKSGTYQVVGDRVIINIEDRPETFSIENGHLKATHGSDSIDFVKTK